jgi:hypothetical protein
LAPASLSLSPYVFVGNNPILFNDPFGLDTVRVNGGGSHKIRIGNGDVLAWTEGDVTSYYTYDPTNSDAVNGFVGTGIDGGTLEGVTVKARARDNTSPWELGVEWLSGLGARSHHFKDGDPFTKMLQKHEHIGQTKNIIADQIGRGARGKIEGTNNIH